MRSKKTTIKEKEDPDFKCGGKDVTYKVLKKRAEELKKDKDASV